MKNILFITVALVAMSFTAWQTNFDVAKVTAREKHRMILLNFSGSDWCGPCILMRKDIFDTDEFNKLADSSLVLVNADFPRNKKNQLSKSIAQQNDALAEKYNSKGSFPLTLLLSSEGKVLKSWEGMPKATAAAFVQELRRAIDANR